MVRSLAPSVRHSLRRAPFSSFCSPLPNSSSSPLSLFLFPLFLSPIFLPRDESLVLRHRVRPACCTFHRRVQPRIMNIDNSRRKANLPSFRALATRAFFPSFFSMLNCDLNSCKFRYVCFILFLYSQRFYITFALSYRSVFSSISFYSILITRPRFNGFSKKEK